MSLVTKIVHGVDMTESNSIFDLKRSEVGVLKSCG